MMLSTVSLYMMYMSCFRWMLDTVETLAERGR